MGFSTKETFAIIITILLNSYSVLSYLVVNHVRIVESELAYTLLPHVLLVQNKTKIMKVYIVRLQSLQYR